MDSVYIILYRRPGETVWESWVSNNNRSGLYHDYPKRAILYVERLGYETAVKELSGTWRMHD